jgi:hypothetical protein
MPNSADVVFVNISSNPFSYNDHFLITIKGKVPIKLLTIF